MKHPFVVATIAVGGIGCLFTLIGMASPGWVVSDGSLHAGLFVLCGDIGCESYSATGAMAAAKAIVVIAFLCSLAGFIDSLVYYFKYVNKDISHRKLSLIVIVLFVVAVVGAILGAIIFGAAGKSEAEEALGIKLTLGYSLGLTIVGGLFCGAAAGLSIVHHRGQQS